MPGATATRALASLTDNNLIEPDCAGHEGIRLQLYYAAPENDLFSNAKVIEGLNGWPTDDTNAGASKETGEPDHGDPAGGRSVWYSWTAPNEARVQIGAYGLSGTLLAVYTGTSVSELTRVVWNTRPSP